MASDHKEDIDECKKEAQKAMIPNGAPGLKIKFLPLNII